MRSACTDMNISVGGRAHIGLCWQKLGPLFSKMQARIQNDAVHG